MIIPAALDKMLDLKNLEERRSFTAEELALAKSVDLTAVAASLGYTVKKIGRYHTLKEMDSIRIYNRTNWFRWSREHDRGNNGGSQIDFLRVFAGMEVKDAVFWLLDFSGYRRDGDWEKKSANVYVEKIEGKHYALCKRKFLCRKTSPFFHRLTLLSLFLPPLPFSQNPVHYNPQ